MASLHDSVPPGALAPLTVGGAVAVGESTIHRLLMPTVVPGRSIVEPSERCRSQPEPAGT